MPIPFSEAAAYYEFMDLNQHYSRERWFEIVAVLDQAMIEFGQKRAKQKERKNSFRK